MSGSVSVIILKKQKTERYKAYLWWGAADISWRGDNFRKLSVPGQPHLGYETAAEAEAHVRKMFKTKRDLDATVGYQKGSPLREEECEDAVGVIL